MTFSNPRKFQGSNLGKRSSLKVKDCLLFQVDKNISINNVNLFLPAAFSQFLQNDILVMYFRLPSAMNLKGNQT